MNFKLCMQQEWLEVNVHLIFYITVFFNYCIFQKIQKFDFRLDANSLVLPAYVLAAVTGDPSHLISFLLPVYLKFIELFVVLMTMSKRFSVLNTVPR